MKKSLIALAALATVATAAQAQSSVAVYGLLDAGVSSNFTANNSGQGLTAAANGILATSRLGFRGTEDLGGGLKANFVLESGLNPQTGAQSRSNSFFDRRAVVGLEGSWGKLDLGRNTNVGFDYAGAGITDPLSLAYDGYANAVAATTAFGASQKINTVITVVSNTTLGTTRNDGTIKYTYTAKDNSYQVAGAYKPGGVAGGGAEGSAYSAGGRVTVGILTAAYSHFEATDSANRKLKYDSVGATAKATASLKFTAGYHELKADAAYGKTADCTYAASGSAAITAATGKTCSAPNLTTEVFAGAPGADDTRSGKLKVTTVGASYSVSPAYTVTLAYNEAKVTGASNGKLENYVLQNQYALSKRTQLYGTVASSQATSGAKAFAQKGTATAVIAGVQHSF